MSEKDKFKFSSSFLKKPFLSNNTIDKVDLEKEEFVQNNQDNIIEDIENENSLKTPSKINNYDITYSISELHRPQTSLFNKENNSSKLPNNLSISTSTVNSKKRKPFENLTFYSERNKLNININNNDISDKNKEEKDDQSIMSDIQFKNNLNPLKESQTEFNSSQISQNEKSMIISSYKLISKETVEKAKKLNKQYKQTPFWIKFFEEIENDTLKNNSSYFKINNKNEYIKNLVTMIQRDADLYDKLQKSKEIKQETENEIKKLIEENNINDNIIDNMFNIENNKNNGTTNNTSKIKRHNSSKISFNNNNNNVDNNNINNNINQTDKKNDKKDINEKFSRILESYNKLDEKERRLYFNEDDYESFKFKLITGGKFNSEKEKEIEKIPVMIKKLENLEDITEKPMTEKEKKKDEILKIKGIKEFKTIDMLYFGNNYTFEELNYNKIDFYIFNKESLPKILALDKRLHDIDPERYKTSINTDLKKLQDEFNAGKEERMKRAEKEIRDKFNKYMEDSKETKKTIFDIKPKDESKIKYKDYLHYNDEIKKERKELKTKLNKLDDKIKLIHSNNNKELSEEQLLKFSQELEQYHSSEEFKQKYDSIHVPGLSLLNRTQKELKEFENNNKELEQGLIESKKLIKEQEKKQSKEEKEKYLKEIVEPFYEHEKEVDEFDKENKNDIDKVKQLEEDMKKEEELLNNIQNNLDELNQNKNKYEEMFEEADKIIMENNINGNNNDNENINDIDYVKKYEVEKILEEQKENEKLMEQLDNQMQFFEEKLQNIKKSNEDAEKELKEKKFMTPEEFCKVPDELMKLLKEIEEDKNNNNEEINKKNNDNDNDEFEEDSLDVKDKEENKYDDINSENKETNNLSDKLDDRINNEEINDINDNNEQKNEINKDNQE